MGSGFTSLAVRFWSRNFDGAFVAWLCEFGCVRFGAGCLVLSFTDGFDCVSLLGEFRRCELVREFWLHVLGGDFLVTRV